MFKTLIYGMGALILGMLVYLYSEISQLRDSMAAVKPGALVVYLDPVADAPAPEGMKKTLQATFSYPDRQLKIYRTGHYEISDKRIVSIHPFVDTPQQPVEEAPAAAPLESGDAAPQQEGSDAAPQEPAPTE